MNSKRVRGLIALALAALFLIQGGTASAFPWLGTDGLQHEVGGPYDWPPYYGGDSPTSPVAGYSFSIIDDFTHIGHDTSTLWPLTGGPNGLTWTCEGFKDAACVTTNQLDPGWQFNRVLPPCKSTIASESCIEGLYAGDNSGTERALALDHILPTPLQWDSSIGRNLGAGSAPSLWHDPNDPDLNHGYLVSVSGTGQCPPDQKCTEIQNFSASVTPYKTQVGNFGGNSVWTTPNGHKGIQGSAPPICLWQEVGKCGLASNFGNDSNLKLKLHLPTNISGWYMGRFRDPDVVIQPIDAKYYRLTVAAKPAEIPLVTAKVDLANMDAAQKEFFASWSCFGGGYCGPNLQSNDVINARYFDLFAPQLNNTAQLLAPKWSVRSVQSAFPCSQSGKVDGIVSTDATLYDGTPPSFENGSMNYHVAALHNLPDGSIFQGHYNLLMASEFARCLYRFSNAPVSAKVEVINSQGSTSISTSTLTESAGWLHLAVNGFTFSNPTIQVKLTQDAPAPVATPTPSTTVALEPNVAAVVKPSPPVVIKKATITCVKGKLTKSVTGVKPTCPTGYKKK